MRNININNNNNKRCAGAVARVRYRALGAADININNNKRCAGAVARVRYRALGAADRSGRTPPHCRRLADAQRLRGPRRRPRRARPNRQEQAQLPGGPSFSHYVTWVVRPMVCMGLNI